MSTQLNKFEKSTTEKTSFNSCESLKILVIFINNFKNTLSLISQYVTRLCLFYTSRTYVIAKMYNLFTNTKVIIYLVLLDY